MGYLHDDNYDAALNNIKNNAENLWILKADPVLLWTNIATHGVGFKAITGADFTGPADGAISGRKITLNAITGGQINATDPAASHYAITDDSLTKILASGPLGANQAVTDGNTFSLTAIDITVPDAV